jgi:hypothetical protein
VPTAALPELKASLAFSLVSPGAALRLTMNRRMKSFGSVGAGPSVMMWTVCGSTIRVSLHAADIDRRRIRARHHRDALDRELDVLRREVRAVVELDAAAQLELPGGGVDQLPALGEAGLDLELVARPGQRVEDVLHRLGMGAGGGEVRIHESWPGTHADGQRLRDRSGRQREHGGEGPARETRGERMMHGELPVLKAPHGRVVSRSRTRRVVRHAPPFRLILDSP